MYVGRFAPSPTGPLHFGSLVAAVASYCDAKVNHGKWLLRIEDLDKPREIAGAADTILRQLEAFGFEWDGEIIYQSQRHAFYTEAFQQLNAQHLLYPCTCTRKEITDSSQQWGIEGVIYPKTCLTHALKPLAPSAWRIKTNATPIQFEDAIQGTLSQQLNEAVGDFILKRADGLFAYQLAVVVDDAAQGITHIVRGADLLASTPRQIYLQQLLQLNTPHYAHVPLACNAAGEKLSKQTLAKSIDASQANQRLLEALSFLGQHPPDELKNATMADLWHWAMTYWQLENVPKIKNMVVKM